MKYEFIIFVLTVFLSGCATNSSNQHPTEIAKINPSTPLTNDTVSMNPMHGDNIWGSLSVGMSIKDVMEKMPNSKFDDQWSSGGMVGIMAEAGILATNKIKVTTEITGPFSTMSTLYIMFDKNMRLDGIIIGTKRQNLPSAINANFGTIGYYLPEFKDAAKQIIRYGIPELGKREGVPKFGKEQLDSIGTVGIAKGLGNNKAIGIAFSAGSISPSSISQLYKREGYKSLLSVRAVYLGTYGVYSGIFVFMMVQAKSIDDDDIPDVE